uniref:Uncharacterized protein n=1 Tax=Podoviridae sp. ctIKM86 TaxID=2827729 RepID=A0A8S5SMR7_9CAUD|nr:MAG TPA: hypothetical protein [Podoviridae sp. ctIKM86]
MGYSGVYFFMFASLTIIKLCELMLAALALIVAFGLCSQARSHCCPVGFMGVRGLTVKLAIAVSYQTLTTLLIVILGDLSWLN